MDRTHSRRWLMLAVLCLSELLATIDNTVVNVALPTLSRSLDASTSSLQWIVDSYTLVFAGLLLVGGHLGDRFGRRRMLQAGLVLFAVFSFAASFSSTADQLILWRALMGAAAALIFPATLGLLSNIFTDGRERATAIGIWAGVAGLAVALGPLLGGALLEHFDWSSIFLVNLPVVAVALLLGRLLLPESRDARPGRFDALGALLSIGGVGVLVFTVIEAPAHGWVSAFSATGFVAAAGLLTAFVVWSARRADPLFDVRLFTDRRVSAASFAITASSFALFGFIFLITQFFQVVHTWGPLRAGVATLPFALVTAGLSPVAIVVMKRLGTRFVIVLGLTLMAVGFAVASFSTLESAYFGRILVSMVFMAAGLAFTAGPATDAIMGALPVARAGAGSALNDTTREVGGTLGVAVVGSVMSSLYAPHLATSLAALGVPAAVSEAAGKSVVAGLSLIPSLPGPVRGPAAHAVRQAFMDGLSAGSLVCAAATFAAAAGVLLFLPAHTPVREDDVSPVPVA